MKRFAAVIISLLLIGCASSAKIENAFDAGYVQGYRDGIQMMDDARPASAEQAFTWERFSADHAAAKKKVFH